MNAQETAKRSLDHGDRFPYDGGEEFWNADNDFVKPKPVRDKAHRTARGILADLCDRRGIKHELDEVDHDVRSELVEQLAEIIRVGMAE